MTRRALLLAACAAFVPAAHAAPRPRRIIWKPRKPQTVPPGSVEPKAPKTVRTMCIDGLYRCATFEQRWAGDP